MGSNRLHLIPGTSAAFVVDLTDTDGLVIPSARLDGAGARVRVRVDPSSADVLAFNTPDAIHLSVDAPTSTLNLSFTVADTNQLTVGTPYFWQLELDLTDGEVLVPIDWTPVDVDRGGSAATPPPVFTNTVKVDHDYMLPDDLRYMTPGGTPIDNAQVRMYLKSDYMAGRLTAPTGITSTDAYGRWVNALFALPGYSYIVRMEKPGFFGPDTREIIALIVGP